MANYLAIAAVAKTVLKLVEDHCPRDEFAATPKFTLVSGHDFGATPVAEGFTLLVWRVSVNSAVRNQPARRTPDGRKRRPALPVDLGLMLTPWSFIEDHAIVPASMLNQSLSRRAVPAFNADEAIEIFHDAPSLPDYLGLWDKFRNRWQTSLTYTVRMVGIESEIGSDEGAPVQTRDFAYGQPAAEGGR
jgi:hypothetical protein